MHTSKSTKKKIQRELGVSVVVWCVWCVVLWEDERNGVRYPSPTTSWTLYAFLISPSVNNSEGGGRLEDPFFFFLFTPPILITSSSPLSACPSSLLGRTMKCLFVKKCIQLSKMMKCSLASSSVIFEANKIV